MNSKSNLAGTTFGAVLMVCTGAALAQGFPAKPVHLVVPYAAGGAVDTMARVFAPKYQEMWGRPVLVENRAGAGGNVGADLVAKAAPDGHTLLMNTSGQAIAVALYRKLNYDPLKDLVPITTFTAGALVLVTPGTSPVKSVRDLIDLARRQPGKINFGSTGIGSNPHLAQELFKSMAGIDIVHVPYKGDAQLFPALFANEVQMAVIPSQTGIAHIKAGRINALAVTPAKRSRFLTEVPTVAEAGLAGFEISGWVGLFAPGGTPREVIRKITEDTFKVIRAPEVAAYYVRWGTEPMELTTEQFVERFHADIEKYTRIIREAKIPQVGG